MGINVLSLFDGISCGRIALERVGIKVDNYFSSEIEPNAINISNKNYPQDEVNRLGDVTKWKDWNIDWSSIDLVTGGFPCQAWSLAGKQLGDKDERGMLFWVMLDIMKKVLEHNPKAKFLIENVKMKKEFEEYITLHTTNALGEVYKHLIDSSLLSAQRRKRYYWTNIENIQQPEDMEILFSSILDEVEFRELPKCAFGKFGDNQRIDSFNYINNQKSNTLTTNNSHTTQYLLNEDKTKCRLMTQFEWERLQTLPPNYTDGFPKTTACKAIGNGWTVDVIAHIFKGLK